MEISNRYHHAIAIDERDIQNEPFNAETYLEAIQVLQMRIQELQNQRNRPLKSRVCAYVTTGLFAPASIGVLLYYAVLDAGWASDNREFHLGSSVTLAGMTVLSVVAIAAWQRLGCETKQQEEVDKLLHQKKKYKQFKVAAIAFFQNPNSSLFNLLRETYQALPEETKMLHQKDMEKANQLFISPMSLSSS